MDDYLSDELFDQSPLQTSCSSGESGDSEPEADTSPDKHMEFIRNAFRAKQPQQLDNARPKTSSAKSSSMFLTPSRPHSSTRRENTSTALKRTPRSVEWTPGTAGPVKDRSHEMSTGGGDHHSTPLQEAALAEVLNGLTGQLKRVVSCLDRQGKRMESIERQLYSATSSASSSSESRRSKEKGV